jgi:DhnA family fructose-bisphosphate aldolase class Ia
MNGIALRVSQLLNPTTSRSVIVAFDHGGSGVPKGGADVGHIVDAVAASGAEGLLVGPGVARHAAAALARPGAPRLLVSLDAPIFSPLPGEHGKLQDHVRVATPEYALHLGATAAKVLLPVGFADADRFAKSVDLLRVIAMDCHRIGLPLMVEPALWGEKASETDNELIAHACRMGVEIGADILKIPAPPNAEVLAGIVRNSPVPVMVLGGSPRDAAGFVDEVAGWMKSGAVGVVVGRNVWSRPDPKQAVAALAATVHRGDAAAAGKAWTAAGEPGK